jgi:hypothetical protein
VGKWKDKLWSSKEDEQLLAGRAAGKTFAEIAAGMNRSRNAALGRAARLAGTVFPCDQAKRDQIIKARAAKVEERERVRDAVIAKVRGMPRGAAIRFARSAGLTYEEVGAGVGYTGERVRQIVRRQALREAAEKSGLG